MPVVRLKAERVQLRIEPQEGGVLAERLRRLEEAPVWELDPGRSIAWVRRFPDAGTAAAYASYLAQLAVRAGHPMEIALANQRVLVTLRGRLEGGRRGNLTEEALAFAQAFA
jgi:pterin-4a-carbinolamine dehydratase